MLSGRTPAAPPKSAKDVAPAAPTVVAKKGAFSVSASGRSDWVVSSARAPHRSSETDCHGRGRRDAWQSVWASAGLGTDAGKRRDSKAAGGIKLSSLNPRAQRVKQILEVVELEVERFVDLDQQPIPKYDLYQRKLRSTGGVGESSLLHGTWMDSETDWSRSFLGRA